MPHRAGYFVLAYQWDHHCDDLFQSIRARFQRMLAALLELEQQAEEDSGALLHYYQKWHYNRELYRATINTINRKQHVINSLGYRGYGVNKDLFNALESLKNEYEASVYSMLERLFKEHAGALKKIITLPKEQVDAMNSGYVLVRLCEKLNLNPLEHIPVAIHPVDLKLEHYFQVMSKETLWPVNTAIFEKLFLNLGNSSMTIMQGSTGYHNVLSEQDLKIAGNRNFIAMVKDTFSNLHNFTDIGIDLLKRIHFVLSRDIDPNAGNFREYDFPDKNGVTFDFGNFEREMRDLDHVLRETGESFHDLHAFIYNLSRSYYMFIGIHPFRDSNGRTGKCFLNHMLIKKGLPPLSFVDGDGDEIFALPRYGGTMDDMHDYVKARIMKAVDAYFYERWKLEHFGFIAKQIYNVSFDSGFHFRQINDNPQKIEVNFQAFIIDDSNQLCEQYQDQCRVVLPHENLLKNMKVYCGLSRDFRGEWENVLSIKDNFFINEIKSDIPGARVFDAGFIVRLQDVHFNCRYFNCCVVSDECGRIFNNKGLNYTYKIEKYTLT